MDVDVLKYVTMWLTEWQARTLTEHLLAALAGLFGALVYVVITGPELKLPRYCEKTKTIRLNFVGTLMVGVLAAVAADIAFPVGMVVATLAPPVTHLVIRHLPKALVKALMSWLPKENEGNG